MKYYDSESVENYNGRGVGGENVQEEKNEKWQEDVEEECKTEKRDTVLRTIVQKAFTLTSSQ